MKRYSNYNLLTWEYVPVCLFCEKKFSFKCYLFICLLNGLFLCLLFCVLGAVNRVFSAVLFYLLRAMNRMFSAELFYLHSVEL